MKNVFIKILNKIRKRFYLVLRIISYLLIITAIVFIFIYLTSKNEECCCCCNQSDFFYNCSIAFATIGFGICTAIFSGAAERREKLKRRNILINNTKDCYEKYERIASSNDYLFVEKVLEDISRFYHIDTISDSFYANETKYLDNMIDLIGGEDEDIDKFLNKTEEFVSGRLNYLFLSKEDKKIIEENSKTILFEKSLINVMRSIEPLCYEYINQNVSSDIFKDKIIPNISKIYLRSYLYLCAFGLNDNDLVYLKFSILLKDNDSVIMKIEKEQ